MIVGIDIDNTIINYDNVFKRNAKKLQIKLKKKNNIKREFKENIISTKGPKAWTSFQGKVYGSQLNSASLYPGFLRFYKYLQNNNFKVYFVSHKTIYPILGKKINLRNKTKKFLKNKVKNLNSEIIFCDSIEKKIEQIKKKNCDIFIDDLEKILNFIPNSIYKIHFNAKGKKKFDLRTNSWNKIFFSFKKKYLFKIKNQGNNNTIYLNRKNNIIYKYYKKNQKSLESFVKETNFYKNFQNEINCIPKLILSDKENLFNKFEYLKGYKIKTFNKNYLEQVSVFINILIKNYKKKKNFNNATENCFQIKDYIKNLEKKFSLIFENKKNFNKINLNFINFLYCQFELEKKIILRTFKKSKKFKVDQKIISPSDLNINNIICQNKKLYFIDFEYSGIDGVSKLLLDFILNPDNKISFNKIKILINLLNLKNPKQVVVIIKLMLKVNIIKWSLILIGSNIKTKNKFNYFSKAKKYYYSYVSRFIKKNPQKH